VLNKHGVYGPAWSRNYTTVRDASYTEGTEEQTTQESPHNACTKASNDLRYWQ
jgi:hypothetical protein